jgi:PAS domain S-box-containing protein
VTTTTDPIRDAGRLAALRRSALLETAGDPAFDRLARLAARALGAPVGLVSLVAADRQVFAGQVGLPEPVASRRVTPLSHSFCRHVVAAGEALVVEDARDHPVVGDNLAVRDLGVVAYAGVPVRSPDGHVLGSLCAIDAQPRPWTADDLAALADLAAAVETEIELRATAAAARDELAGRRRAEAALVASEEQLREAVEAADLGTWELDLTTGVLTASARCKEIVGAPPDSPLTREALAARVHPDDRHRMQAALDRALARRGRYEAEYRVIQESGDVTWVAASGRAAYDAAGIPVRMAGVMADVTARKRGAEVRDQLAAIVESAEDAIVGRTLDGTITHWNQGAERLYGYAPAEAIGRPIAILVPEERRAEVPALGERLARGERIEQFETVRRRKDGSQVDVAITLSPIHDAAGRVVGASTVARDITERRQAAAEREALLARERAARAGAEAAAAALARLQALTDAALAHPDLDALLAAVVGRLAEFLTVDAAAVFLCAASGEGLELRAAVCPDGADGEAVGLRVDVGEGFAGRVAAERRVIAVGDIDAGGPASPHLQAMGVRSALGAPLLVAGRLLGVVQVGSRRRRSFDPDDIRLLELAADRLALAVDRSRLFEAERQAREEAEAAVYARDLFLSSASHDLKTPLAGIKGQAQLARRRLLRGDSAPDPRLLGGLGAIEGNADRMAAMIDELLDVARLQIGQELELHREPVDLVRLAHEVIGERQARTPRHAFRIAATLPHLRIVIDRTRIERVLANLVDNAVKYSPDGGEVVVEVGREEKSPRIGAVVVVRDRGIGIPAADLPHVFDPFFRGRNVPGRITGSGIGLAGSRRIVERHGGTLSAASEEGRGSVFTVRLPLVPGDEPVVAADGW